MASSLDKLAKSLPSEMKKILRSEFNHLNAEQMALIERKGVLCYDYIDSLDRFNETALPPKEAFYSHLNDCKISDEDYAHAKNVWDVFNIKTLGEYIELYMKTDVLLLADIFENFRETCHKIYKLDPAHYFTAPGLSFDSMLKMTKVELELINDIDILLFVERGIRGVNDEYIWIFFHRSNIFFSKLVHYRVSASVARGMKVQTTNTQKNLTPH